MAMAWSRGVAAAVLIPVLGGLVFPLFAQDPQSQLEGKPARTQVGPSADGFLLPNGWKLTPAGDQVALTDLPLNIIPLKDGRHALVGTAGYNAHELSLVDLQSKRVVAKETVRQSWFGLAVDQGGHAWWSGGGSGVLHSFEVADGKIARVGDPEPAPAAKKKGDGPRPGFRSGLALSEDGKILYSLDINAATLSKLDAETGKVLVQAKVGIRPYDVVVARNGSRLYVSDWAGRAVLAVDPTDLRVVQSIGTGEHPNQIILHPEDDRLFVACASSNSVAAIDTKRGVVVETIFTGLFPKAPEGSTPDALAITPDGETLFVANADNNCVAVVEVEEPKRSVIKGFIPTGWYPTSLAVTRDGKNLLVGVGKGNATKPNPIDRAKYGNRPRDPDESSDRGQPFPYIGTTLSGALSVVPLPDDKTLAGYTEAVYRNCPYSDNLMAQAKAPAEPTAIPSKVGDPSPIKHILYILKENRTYDQVLGALPQGNGDPNLVMFGRDVTPNHHKLAEEFVLLDNLYCNGHVSADGHPWSTMAYATDYLARNWALTYSRRTGVDLDDEAELHKAPSGFLWDACARQNLTYRSYGEYGKRVSQPDGSVRMEAAAPGLIGHISDEFGVAKTPGARTRDTDNADTFLRELRQFERDGNLPRFMIMSLGEDHTSGTTPGAYTPSACVASNDVALGRIVEAVSHSKFWPETAIFVIEDDAQNGPDHVDAHRTVGFVISPYTKRKSVDSTMYQTVSMIRSIELILGLPPLSQFDAAATPMYASFTKRADLTPYTALPAAIDLNTRNVVTAYGAERSGRMDFSDYDKVDDFELNEILWHAVKGPEAPMPPAVRRAIAYRPSR